ncbi:MAG TPA: Ig-like domain-containing protein [Nocardioidaceae bacterium]|nr:Ig-like domain-containing protein [Nocardioidaceae bacterium]
MLMRTLAIGMVSLAWVASTAPADATVSPTHDYEMNEPAGASVMVDSGSTPVNGTVGSEVITGVTYGDATGYRFPRLKPNTPPAHPEHLVSVPDDPSLDPGAGDYSVEIRYRTTNSFGNLIQKGQATTRGGQIKIQLPKGRPSCYYKGSSGRVGIGAPSSLADGAWHTLVCTRTSTAVDLYVDGVHVGHKNGVSGTIDNTFPMTIGGKPQCDQVKVTCDYFGGDVDYVRLTKGPLDGGGPAVDTTPPSVSATSPSADALDTRRGGNVTATFSEPVRGVSASTMTLRRASTGEPVSAAVTYDAGSRTAILDPDVFLPGGTRFTVSLTPGVTDMSGNHLAATSWSFTTTR